MWFKMGFHEPSVRVPLMIAAPGRLPPGRVATPVSLLDVTPTLCELAGLPPEAVAPWVDGESLIAAAAGRRGPVPMEYAAEGSAAPIVALRDGPLKLVLCALDPPLLFDLDADPEERVNLATDPARRDDLDRMCTAARARWDLAAYDAAVRRARRGASWFTRPCGRGATSRGISSPFRRLPSGSCETT